MPNVVSRHFVVTFVTFGYLALLIHISSEYPGNRDKVAGCAKHYVGDGGTYQGINEGNAIISMNELFDIHMPPFFDSIRKGVATVMVSYSSLNGVKMHANGAFITSFLKDILNFRVNHQYPAC